jgi:hypothetical protein
VTGDNDECSICSRRLAAFEAASLESLERGTDVGGWYVTLHVDNLDLLEWLRQ